MGLATLRRFIACCLLAWCWQAHAGIRLADDRGVAFVAAQAPQRIVSLLPSLTESVCALGGCDRVVGTDRFSNWPVQVQRLPKLGGLEDAQVERIVALRPDVVLVEPSARVIDRLESLGLKVFVLDVQTHADAKRALWQLAQMLDTPERASAEWQRIERELDVAARRVPAALRGQRVYVEVDAAPYAAGASSFIGETLTRLGLGNIVPPALGAFPRLNPEFVVNAQPDLVVASQTNLADMAQRPGWSSLRALRARRSCGFPMAQYELIVRPGPRMGEAAGLLVDCLATLAGEP
ncbi:MAG: ABC transporter substrate-binding protein [Rhizobacter sp.]|nr:ABC transporter substrate-binding protein [Rhizobacter sp.]